MSDRGSVPPTLAQVMETVKMLSGQIEEGAEAERDLAAELSRRRSEARWIALAILVALTIITVAAWIFRVTDNQREQDRRQALAQQIFTQRESQVLGCERTNQIKATLRQVISESYAPAPPASVPPELERLLAESVARAAAKRDSLLALPGVQDIDCAAAYPVPALQDRP